MHRKLRMHCRWFHNLFSIYITVDTLLSQQSVNFEEVMNIHAQKAQDALQLVMDHDGVWDIFITKHVEVYSRVYLLIDLISM